MLMTANSSPLTQLSPTGLYAMLAVAVVGMGALLFTTYRTVVGYFLAGMAYWLAVEALAWLLITGFVLDDLHGYVFAVGLTFVPILMALNWLETRRKDAASTGVSLKVWLSRRLLTYGLNAAPQKSRGFPARPTWLVAGQRPFLIEQDTDFSQHFIRHSPVFDYE